MPERRRDPFRPRALEKIAVGTVFPRSAKITEENEITPESNYVEIRPDGHCKWEPRFELSATQCPVHVTWFPFDRQTCDIIFVSWMLPVARLQLDTATESGLEIFHEPDGWHVTGERCVEILSCTSFIYLLIFSE